VGLLANAGLYSVPAAVEVAQKGLEKGQKKWPETGEVILPSLSIFLQFWDFDFF